VSRIILGWQVSQPIDEGRVHELVEQISRRYQPLFLERLQCVSLCDGNQGLLHFDVPHDADLGVDCTEDRVCCLSGRPTTADNDSGLGTEPLGARVLYSRLVTSTGAIQTEMVRGINPPFTLCWFDRRSARVGVVHDGLGQDQFFVSHTSAGIVFSNRCWPILQLLGQAPQIDQDAWKYWFCMGWFPETSTPLRNVRVLDSGEIIVGDSHTVSSSTSDALCHWIQRGSQRDAAVLMDQAADAVRDVVRQHPPGPGGFEADLTGGIDSRAICSLLINQGFRTRYYTGGPKLSPDVILAKRIASQFGLDWLHVQDPRFTQRTDLPDTVDTQFRRMMLWGEGLVQPTRFHQFQVARAPTREGLYLGGGSSEISKGHYYHHIVRRGHEPPFSLDDSLVRLAPRAADLLAKRDASCVTQLLRQQLGEGAVYGVRDWSLLDYFYLHERTRRWQSAHVAINLFDNSILPFVNTDHITLAFAMRPLDKAGSAFQRFLIRRNQEALLRIPLSAEVSRTPSFVLMRLWSRLGWVRRGMSTSGWADYFRCGGRASVERVLRSDSPLWEILDRSEARKKWNDWVEGATADLGFPLTLLAFWFWHAMLVEETSL
jgi:asparagine synthetase B (glutamine-hydrolysing)